jgi:hypothetical protein
MPQFGDRVDPCIRDGKAILKNKVGAVESEITSRRSQ